MKEKIYLTDDMVILNFDLAYPESRSDLLKSKEFKAFVAHYLEYLRERVGTCPRRMQCRRCASSPGN